jgi:hypothetical protein
VRLYLDTAPVIYTVEQVPGYASAVDVQLSAPELVLVASDLTRMECRVKPLRDGNAGLPRFQSKSFNRSAAMDMRIIRNENPLG